MQENKDPSPHLLCGHRSGGCVCQIVPPSWSLAFGKSPTWWTLCVSTNPTPQPRALPGVRVPGSPFWLPTTEWAHRRLGDLHPLRLSFLLSPP